MQQKLTEVLDEAFRKNVLFLETFLEIEQFEKLVDDFFISTLESAGFRLAEGRIRDVITTQPLLVITMFIRG